MAWQLTIDNAQLTIQKIMIFQFSILNFQLKKRYSYSCYSYFSKGSL